jgi:hypothetical protein
MSSLMAQSAAAVALDDMFFLVHGAQMGFLIWFVRELEARSES